MFILCVCTLKALLDRYRSRLRRLAQLAHEQPIKPLDKAVFWIEYVIRHKGAAHLRSPAIDVPFYRFYMLDVAATLILTLLFFVYALRLLVNYILSSIVIKHKSKTA